VQGARNFDRSIRETVNFFERYSVTIETADDNSSSLGAKIGRQQAHRFWHT
jgi:hypothetical protein